MKRLYFFSIRSFAGPFLATFAISMFILVMQFFWVYIDDLMGKGLEIAVITELLFYVSTSLIPLALPLAILLSSIMTFGNLAENNELTALKASGQSLFKIIKPLSVVAVVIAISTFYFANYVIPISNFKSHSLMFDIQNTKISAVISPGVYNHELDGYVIKVDEGEGNSFKGILIHDCTTPNVLKTIRAEEGEIHNSKNGPHLFFKLKNGTVTEELEPQTPKYGPDGRNFSKHSRHSARRTSFDVATYKIVVSGFDLQRSREEIFKEKHEMLNVFQIEEAMDSITKNGTKILDNFLSSIRSHHHYLASYYYSEHSVKKLDDQKKINVPNAVVNFNKLEYQKKIDAIKLAQTNVRKYNHKIKGQQKFVNNLERDMNDYMIEFNRKFALTTAIIILFFIGAPLGAIVSKGGFGAPVVIAALLFMVYFILLTVGDNLAKSGSVSPFVGMWFSSFVLAPIAVIFMYSAANDVPINSREFWSKLFKRSFGIFKRKKA